MEKDTRDGNKKIIYIDASSLKSDSLCSRKYLLHIVRGYTRGIRAANYKAGYGTAFHAGLQTYYGFPPEKRKENMVKVAEAALKAFEKYAPHVEPDDFRNGDHLFKSIFHYHQRYQRGDSIVPLSSLLETKFCIPWYECDEYIIYLTGTIDLIADWYNRIVIWDHKSTATPQHKIAEFFEAFKMNIQTQFYVWIFRQLSKMPEYVPILINGIFIKKPTKKAEDKGEFDGVHFERSQLIEYDDEQMAQFEWWLKDKLSKIRALIDTYGLKELDKDPVELGPVNPAACHAGFGLCPFFEVCQQPPSLQIQVLKSKYIIDQYNPLAFND